MKSSTAKTVRRLRAQLESFRGKPPNFLESPEFKAWMASVTAALHEAYGEAHEFSAQFAKIEYGRFDSDGLFPMSTGSRWGDGGLL